MSPEMFMDIAKQRHAELSQAADAYRLATEAKAGREPRSRGPSRTSRFLRRAAIAK
jgi:hypothetical protein